MKTIVIVEDEFRIRQGLSHLINKVDMGCKVIGEAENGYDGLKMIHDIEPDIVITDIQMPKFDGLQMIEKAKEMGAVCEFVILSGYANFDYAKKGIHLGVNEYLLKPITITDVKNLLQKFTQVETKEELSGNSDYSKTVQDMIKTIEEGYGMRLGLDTFAEKYRLTPEYLSNLCKGNGNYIFQLFKKSKN